MYLGNYIHLRKRNMFFLCIGSFTANVSFCLYLGNERVTFNAVVINVKRKQNKCTQYAHQGTGHGKNCMISLEEIMVQTSILFLLNARYILVIGKKEIINVFIREYR